MKTLKKIFDEAVKKLSEKNIELNEAKLEVSLLIEEVFNLTKKDLILNSGQKIPDEQLEKFNCLIKRRINEKIPVQYLINKAWFMGEEFYVNENVLIPRPETELLVEELVLYCREDELKIIDIGTGSGCIAIMLAKKLPYAKITASDISAKALEVAKFNAEKLNVNVEFVKSDIFENIEKSEKFDIIVSNPPYISAKEKENLQIEVSQHEPMLALFVEDDEGLSFYRKLAKQAFFRLPPRGFLAVEVGFSQASDVEKIFLETGFKNIKVIKDLSGIERIVCAEI